MLTACGTLLTSTLEGRDVFASEYNPRTELTEREQKAVQICEAAFPETVKKTNAEIKRDFQASKAYKILHPAVKKWINQNTGNYHPDENDRYLLYSQDEVGLRVIYQNGGEGRFWIERTRFYPDDAAFSFPKEKAVNPSTKKPWITLSSADLKKIMRETGQKFSKEDQQFLKDVLSVLNENFHYFYGARFVRLSEQEVEKQSLVGKFVPAKAILTGKNADLVMEGDETEQQQELHRRLGHPIYSYDNLIDPDNSVSVSFICAQKGTAKVKLKTGETVLLPYWVDLDMKDIYPDLGTKFSALGHCPRGFHRMLSNLKKLCEERGVNLTDESANTTAMAKALYLIYDSTKEKLQPIINHEYVGQDRIEEGFIFGEKRLSDMIELPGVKGTGPKKQTGKKITTQKKQTTSTSRRKKDRER